jgi:4a-hydroxytetrahydrobiopterin dehydratase
MKTATTPKKLEEGEVADRMLRLRGWTRDGNAIERTFEFRNFKEAMTFVGRVAEAAEGAQHHPDIDIRYSKVRLALSTHSAGGLTEKDFALAERVDGLAVNR